MIPPVLVLCGPAHSLPVTSAKQRAICPLGYLGREVDTRPASVHLAINRRFLPREQLGRLHQGRLLDIETSLNDPNITRGASR